MRRPPLKHIGKVCRFKTDRCSERAKLPQLPSRIWRSPDPPNPDAGRRNRQIRALQIFQTDYSRRYLFGIDTKRSTGTDIICPCAFLSFSAVSVQTYVLSLLPAFPCSQSYVPFSTAPTVISKPAAILCLFLHSASLFAPLAATVSDYGRLFLHQLPQPD